MPATPLSRVGPPRAEWAAWELPEACVLCPSWQVPRTDRRRDVKLSGFLLAAGGKCLALSGSGRRGSCQAGSGWSLLAAGGFLGKPLTGVAPLQATRRPQRSGTQPRGPLHSLPTPAFPMAHRQAWAQGVRIHGSWLLPQASSHIWELSCLPGLRGKVTGPPQPGLDHGLLSRSDESLSLRFLCSPDT